MRSRAEPDYARAIRAAYEMREKYDTGGLRFDPFLPISVLPNLLCAKFSTMAEMNGADIQTFLLAAPSSDGFTLRRGKNYIIAYNDSSAISPGRIRFTLTHELGHVFLRHRENGYAEEEEANAFARNLLAPRLLAIERGIEFPDYPNAFGISAAAARMCERRRMLDEQYMPSK